LSSGGMPGAACMITQTEFSWLPSSPNLYLEEAYWKLGAGFIAGIDEAGRGAWAGPVSAGVVVLPNAADVQQSLHGVRDSKQMSPAGRREWAEKIKSLATAWAVGLASYAEIDRVGILQATRLAASRAVDNLTQIPEVLLIDWLFLPEVNLPQTAIIKGDNRSLSIACASVLAKTTRDALLVELDVLYPVYGFAAHKGYGTAAHRKALKDFGPCPVHRMSYQPLIDCGKLEEQKVL
jgi:ribonuclease HII